MISTTLPRSDLAGLSAIVAGVGRPVVMLHGVGLRAEAWAAQIGALSGSYRVIAPDMLGHGHSRYDDKSVTVADYAKAVVPLLGTLDGPAVVIGHSMGAMIALELGHKAPEHVAAVAALNAIFERDNDAKTAVQTRAATLDGTALPDPTPTLERWFGTAHSPERDACDRWLRTAHPQGYKQAYAAFAHADGPSRPALEALACPALFVTGAHEPNSTPDMSRAMADLAPQGRAVIIDDAAHMMPMTHPEAVNGTLLEFIREVWP